MDRVERLKSYSNGIHGDFFIEVAEYIENMEAWLEWISEHSFIDAEVPIHSIYINMPPNEGASHALKGHSIKEYVE